MEYKIIEPKKYQDIQNQYQVNSLLAKVIDIHEYDQETLQTLLSPRLIYHDFSLFEEADMTLERIHEAIENEEKICIYGDYDNLPVLLILQTPGQESLLLRFHHNHNHHKCIFFLHSQ